MRTKESFLHIYSLDLIINLDYITRAQYRTEPMQDEERDFPHLEVFFLADAPRPNQNHTYPSLDLRGETAKKVWECMKSMVTYEI